jgi:nitronate monooxygenase
VLTNAAVEEILAIEREKGSAPTIEDIRQLVGGAGNRRVLQYGELDAGAWSCGMVTGLIHDIPTCKELIDRIMAEAEAIIRSRLEGLFGCVISAQWREIWTRCPNCSKRLKTALPH